MSAILNEINNDIIDLEERLLAEFQRLRELEPSDTYSSIESSINDQISLNLSTHLQALEHSGDRDNLSLRTEEHEQLDERMLVVKNLLNQRIPNAFLEVSHQEVKQSRRALELLVIRARTAAGRKTEKSTTSAAARNRAADGSPKCASRQWTQGWAFRCETWQRTGSVTNHWNLLEMKEVYIVLGGT